MMAAFFFEKAEERGMKTHYRGLLNEKGNISSIKEITEPTDALEVQLVRVIGPHVENGKYDYSAYADGLVNFLLPLEIIYRNGLPAGSSIFNRLESGEITLESIGLTQHPKPGGHLKKPIFDVSTKLEKKDRYLSWKEARELAGLQPDEIEDIKGLLSEVNQLITGEVEKLHLSNEDGKIELAYDADGELMLVDVFGTLDECRFMHDGMHVSKEAARRFYQQTQWYRDVQEAKRCAKENGIEDWRSLCASQPPPLDPELKKIISRMYMAAANGFLEKNVFDVPGLSGVIENYKKWNAAKL